jgi:hypothetical protein
MCGAASSPPSASSADVLTFAGITQCDNVDGAPLMSCLGNASHGERGRTREGVREKGDAYTDI